LTERVWLEGAVEDSAALFVYSPQNMSDPTFFPPPSPMTLAEIASLTGAAIPEGTDASRLISGIGPLDRATPTDVTFFEGVRFAAALAVTRAGACFCAERDLPSVPGNTVGLVVRSPQRAFATVGAHLYPQAMRPVPVEGIEGVSPAAHVSAAARLEAGVTVEAGAMVGAGAEIGEGTLIGAGSVIGPNVRIGRQVAIGAQVTILHAFIGNRVIVHSGARIGQDGFGFIPGAAGHLKVPQIGRVVIQDNVEVGANAAIDRGSNRDTVIGEGTKIDNLVQIGHNCVIGRHCLIAGQAGISGSVTIGDFVMIGGAAGLRDNITIGNGAQIAARSAVGSDIPAGERWIGMPAQPMAAWLRELKALKRLSAARAVRGKGDDEGSDG
jgi:UDP-3-O-[3-hydroxymyristoyl] glucosamine N-acyltransferase